MTEPVDIVNMALSEIGTRSTLASLDDPRPEALHGKLHYERLRKMMLSSAPWGFARKQDQLTQVDPVQLPWAYAYEYPADCLRIRFLTPRKLPFVRGTGRLLYCNVYQAGAVYTNDETDPDNFDPGFLSAFVAVLAAHLVIPLGVAGAAERNTFLQAAMQSVLDARCADANETAGNINHVPDWISARYSGAVDVADFTVSWQALPWEGVRGGF